MIHAVIEENKVVRSPLFHSPKPTEWVGTSCSCLRMRSLRTRAPMIAFARRLCASASSGTC